MLQGTASNAGKSIITAGLCRILLENGLSVAPFKAQNMALNSFVTEDNLEMGRAQVTQAHACRIKPDVHMNPILLKPSKGKGSQIIVMGKPAGHMTAVSYTEFKKKLRTVIHDAYNTLKCRYDVIVIEGAGSPAEINLKHDDITNMYTAKMTNSPVIIVGDIDRGGAYAHLIGTFDLLDPDEQEITAGFIINKFRGDASQLTPANDFLEKRTKRKLFGVVPYINDLHLPDEDSVQFKQKSKIKPSPSPNHINIALIDLPHISNFTDFDPFENEPGVRLFTTQNPEDLHHADIIFLPGSKNTINDMEFLHHKGFPRVIKQCAAEGKLVVGICGGFQMLGNSISDHIGVESQQHRTGGLGLLNVSTTMDSQKHLTQTTARCTENNLEVKGYEIHHGHSVMDETPFLVTADGIVTGCRNTGGNVWGTYIHGVFDETPFRKYILDGIRRKKNLPIPEPGTIVTLDQELSRLAAVLRENLDMEHIYRLLGI